MTDNQQDLQIDTLAIRSGHVRTPQGEHSEPLFLTSSYVFDSSAEAALRFSGENPGNVYSRYTNPTVATFEARIAAMEGAEQAVATSSGMAAILSTCLGLLKSGDHILCSKSVFGATNVLLEKYLGKFGVETTFVAADDMTAWREALRPETRLLFLETPSNPMAEILDIAALGELAQANNALLAVDNCFCTPALQRPLQLGADIVIHSATKYIDGQGRCLGGVVAGRAEQMAEVLAFVRSAGPSLSPFNAWVLLKGLETLRLRIQAHSANAQALAEWLQQQPAVEKVFYAGLADHPGHALARKQQSGFGGVLAFRVKGGREQAWKVIDSVKLLSLTANLGDTKTTIVHPATTTHGRLSEEQRAEAGITENLIRISTGLEDFRDIRDDLAQALAAI